MNTKHNTDQIELPACCSSVTVDWWVVAEGEEKFVVVDGVECGGLVGEW
jgi:hypothetical protein